MAQLLAWAVGDFEYVESYTKRKYNGKNLPVRVYTTRGLKEQGRFALQNASQIVDYFSEVRSCDYISEMVLIASLTGLQDRLSFAKSRFASCSRICRSYGCSYHVGKYQT